MAGAKIARDNNCDFIVALGGGSMMDAAKIMAMMAPNEGDLWDYVSGEREKENRCPMCRCRWYVSLRLPVLAPR